MQRIAFVALLFVIGLVGGTALGTLFVPGDSGLAGPAIALGYGAAAALVALVGGIVAAMRLTPDTLRRALLIEAAVVAAIALWIGYRLSVIDSLAMENAQRQPAVTFADLPMGLRDRAGVTGARPDASRL